MFRDINYTIIFIVAIISFLLGIILVEQKFFVIDKQVNIVTATNIVCNIIIATFISTQLKNKQDFKKHKNDFVNESLKLLIEKLKIFSKQDKSYEKKYILALLKEINILISDSNIRYQIIGKNENLDYIINEMFTIKKIITDKSENEGFYNLNIKDSSKIKDISDKLILNTYKLLFKNN